MAIDHQLFLFCGSRGGGCFQCRNQGLIVIAKFWVRQIRYRQKKVPQIMLLANRLMLQDDFQSLVFFDQQRFFKTEYRSVIAVDMPPS